MRRAAVHCSLVVMNASVLCGMVSSASAQAGCDRGCLTLINPDGTRGQRDMTILLACNYSRK